MNSSTLRLAIMAGLLTLGAVPSAWAQTPGEPSMTCRLFPLACPGPVPAPPPPLLGTPEEQAAAAEPPPATPRAKPRRHSQKQTHKQARKRAPAAPAPQDAAPAQ